MERQLTSSRARREQPFGHDGLVLMLADTHPDLEPEFGPLYREVVEYTVTSVERMYALYRSVAYVHAKGIPGDVVECGVWRGGSSMLAALTLLELGDHARALHLYDTFAGMTPPTEQDVDLHGLRVAEVWDQLSRQGSSLLAAADLEDVRANMARTGFPEDRVHYVMGKVEETIPDQAPEQIALLRLDTDWYESTRHELQHLYPRLAPGGVLIVDDFGHWAGARQAVEEYFASVADAPLLNRVDYTGRVAVKPG